MLEGSCHCGAVAYAIDADPPAEAVRCNCSHCQAKGFLLAFFPEDALRRTADGPVVTYRFNSEQIAHQFCPACGVEPFATGPGPGVGPMVAVNLRTVKGIDIAALQVRDYDGAHLR